MFLFTLITIPLAGMIVISLFSFSSSETHKIYINSVQHNSDKSLEQNYLESKAQETYAFAKSIALFTSLTNLIISLIV